MKQYAVVNKKTGKPWVVGRKIFYDSPGRIRGAMKTSWGGNYFERNGKDDFEIVEYELVRTNKEAEPL